MMFATRNKGIYGFCRKNQVVSQVVEEKSGGIFGISGFSSYLCIREIKIEIHTIKDISFFILLFRFLISYLMVNEGSQRRAFTAL